MRARHIAFLALAAVAFTLDRAALAGPVPGVETFDKKAVDFPVSPSTAVWDIGSDEYLVTFEWIPGRDVKNPGVAGAFNNWNRADLPMEGPDARGAYRVTARIKAGEYEYKFVEGADGWFTDERNPVGRDDNYGGRNSILRLGVYALIAGAKAERGDAKILHQAVLHDPKQALYVDVFSRNDALLRVRTLVNDAQGATITFKTGTGRTETASMQRAASDAQYDYYEYRYHQAPPKRGTLSSSLISYSFEVLDGDSKFPVEGSFSLDLASAEIPDVPEWAKNAIWYQIMVERFRDGDPKNNVEFRGDEPIKDYPSQTHPWRSEWYTELPYERQDGQSFWKWSMYNRMYGGDFAGVIEELDYIKSLGVNAIYFNPVFEAQGSHKYNARNYVHADDGYGVLGGYWPAAEKEDLLDSKTWIMTESDKMAVKMIAEAHKRGIKVIFDGVWNHVGDTHPAFLDVKKNGQKSRFADWFDIKSWEPFEYSGWGGFGGLPEFKKTEDGLYSESLVRHLNDVTRKWMDPNGDGDPSDGVDGWRLDVPMHIPRPFWIEWRNTVKSINPEAYITGEIWDPAEYWLDGKTFDAVMNYQFSKAAFRYFGNKKDKTKPSQFDQELARLRIRYPRAINYVLQNLYESHDTDRAVSRLMNPDLPYDGGNRIQDSGPDYKDTRPDETAYRRLRLMTLFQATYVGAPMIWYGTEVGMFGADDPRCRMPMWWDDMAPYDSPDYVIDTKLREYFRDVFQLRAKHDVLRTGDYLTVVSDDDKDVFGFLRYEPDSKYAYLVVMNNSDVVRTVYINAPDTSVLSKGFRSGSKLFGSAKFKGGKNDKPLAVTLPGISGSVIRFRK